MRTFPILTVVAAIACFSPALAQSDSVIVNGMGGRMLIDPATGKERFVPDLMQPWQAEPIRLHPPRKHRTARRTESAPEADTYAATPEPAPAPPVRPKRTATAAPRPAAPPPPPPSAPVSGFSDFTDLITPQPAAPPRKKAPTPEPPRVAAPPREPQRVAAPPREPARIEKPVQRANVEPPKPARTAPVTAGRKGSIAFTPTATVLTQSELNDIRTLAKALENANGRIELRAYAGMRGEKTSDTRKLSLRRALVVRQELVDAGIPIETISVKALGGTDDDGPLDRVDIFAVD